MKFELLAHISMQRWERWSEDIERVCDDDDGGSRDVERGVAMMTIVGRPLLDPSFLRGGPMPGHRPSFHTVYNASTSTAPMQSFHRAVHSAVRSRTIISKLIILQPMQRYHPCLEILHPPPQSHSDEIYRPFQNDLCMYLGMEKWYALCLHDIAPSSIAMCTMPCVTRI